MDAIGTPVPVLQMTSELILDKSVEVGGPALDCPDILCCRVSVLELVRGVRGMRRKLALI